MIIDHKTDAVSCLLSAGARLHITDNSGLTPLMVAVHGAEMMEGEHTAENIVRYEENIEIKYLADEVKP